MAMAVGTALIPVLLNYFLNKISKGTPASTDQIPFMSPEQKQTFDQMLQGIQGSSSGLFDTLKQQLNPTQENMQAFEAPSMRQFQEQTLPGIAAAYHNPSFSDAGSSGMRNAMSGAGVDLQERLQSMRSQLQTHAMDTLSNLMSNTIGQHPSVPYYQPAEKGNPMINQFGQGAFENLMSQMKTGEFATNAKNDWSSFLNMFKPKVGAPNASLQNTLSSMFSPQI